MKKVDKDRARALTSQAIRNGKLKRPTECSCCDMPAKDCGKIEAHHPDYEFPFDVIWLCRSCHRRRHKTVDEPCNKQKNDSKFVLLRIYEDDYKKLKKRAAKKRVPMVAYLHQLIDEDYEYLHAFKKKIIKEDH